ncbi:MAG: hypothetical protein U0792_07960 [Gemmataceae bacterium]
MNDVAFLPNRPLIRMDEFCKARGVSRNTMHRHMKLGIVPPSIRRPGQRCHAWPRSVVVEFLGLREQPAASVPA